VTDALKPLGLTTRKFAVLSHLRASPGLSFSELARRSRVTVQSVHTMVTAFVEAGLVEDGTAHAGAASILETTAAGNVLLLRARDAIADVDKRFAAAHPELTEALHVHMTQAMDRKR
jgi:DNA-binding MarR family transcriptional regulator